MMMAMVVKRLISCDRGTVDFVDRVCVSYYVLGTLIRLVSLIEKREMWAKYVMSGNFVNMFNAMLMMKCKQISDARLCCSNAMLANAFKANDWGRSFYFCTRSQDSIVCGFLREAVPCP